MAVFECRLSQILIPVELLKLVAKSQRYNYEYNSLSHVQYTLKNSLTARFGTVSGITGVLFFGSIFILHFALFLYSAFSINSQRFPPENLE